MKKKIQLLSIIASMLLATLSITSAIGTQPTSNTNTPPNSPLFTARIQNILHQKTPQFTAYYLGKGITTKILGFTNKIPLDRMIDRALKTIEKQPKLLNTIIQNIQTNPQLISKLQEYNVDIQDLTTYLKIATYNPDALRQELDTTIQQIDQSCAMPIDDPEPAGFSGQLGCLLTFFIVLPIIVMIGTMIATFTIITCLNIGGCFETILGGILESFSQGLQPT